MVGTVPKNRQKGMRLASPQAIELIRMIEEKKPRIAVFRGRQQDEILIEQVLLDHSFMLIEESDGRVFMPSAADSTIFGAVNEGWRCLIPSFRRWGIRMPGGKFQLLRGNEKTPFQLRTTDLVDVLPDQPVRVLVLTDMS